MVVKLHNKDKGTIENGAHSRTCLATLRSSPKVTAKYVSKAFQSLCEPCRVIVKVNL